MTVDEMRAKLAAKIAVAARACQHIERDGENTHHRYRYMSADQVASDVGRALFEAGVIALASYEVLTPVDASHATAKGAVWRYCRVSCTLTLVDAEYGGTLTTQGFGDGVDEADKAILKAQTAAWRDAVKRLVFATSKDAQDPEADERTDREGAWAGPQAQAAAGGRAEAAVRREQGSRRAEDSRVVGHRDVDHREVDHRGGNRREIVPVYDATHKFRFGPGRGVPIGEMSNELLDWYAARCQQELADPSKVQWHERVRAQLDAIRAVARERGMIEVGARNADDDDIPF